MRSGQPVKECAFSRKRQKGRRQNLMKKQDSIQAVTKESEGACTLPPFFCTMEGQPSAESKVGDEEDRVVMITRLIIFHSFFLLKKVFM